MVSQVQICNLALSHTRKGRIDSLSEGSPQARECSLHYDIALDAMLRAYPWRFARKVEALAELTLDWEQRWAYRYRYPIDCLKIIRLVPDIDIRHEINPLIHELRGASIYSDLTPVYLEYTARITDPTLFPPDFTDALSWELAFRIAAPLTADREMRKDAFEMSRSLMAAASMADANESPETSDRESVFAAARG